MAACPTNEPRKPDAPGRDAAKNAMTEKYETSDIPNPIHAFIRLRNSVAAPAVIPAINGAIQKAM